MSHSRSPWGGQIPCTVVSQLERLDKADSNGYSLVSRESKALDLGNFVEECRDRVLTDVEGKVADE